MSELENDTSDDAQSQGLSRRSALALGGLVGLAPMFEWATPALAGTATPLADVGAKRLPQSLTSQRNRPFSQGWKFFRGALTGAETPAFNDDGWRSVDAPHDWRI